MDVKCSPQGLFVNPKVCLIGLSAKLSASALCAPLELLLTSEGLTGHVNIGYKMPNEPE